MPPLYLERVGRAAIMINRDHLLRHLVASQHSREPNSWHAVMGWRW
jgi:hypothetical protein